MNSENMVLSVLDKLNIQVEIKKIIKNNQFIKDDISGLYYINNKSGDVSLFEYNPNMLVLYYSEYITKYLLYRGFDKHNMGLYIKEAINAIFDINFLDYYETSSSVIKNIKKSKLHKLISNKIYNGILSIPNGYLSIQKVSLELIKNENDYTKYGFTRKTIFNSFDAINISSMCNGVYWLRIRGLSTPNNILDVKIKINNSTSIFKSNEY